jgi:hypothetical protein
MKASPYQERIRRLSSYGPKAKNVLGKNISGIDNADSKMFTHAITPDLKVNSDGFRSDEFRAEHKENHLLFAGCSNTFGIGLHKEETWSSRFLYMLSDSGEKVSGYFNLSVPGNSVFDSVSSVMKYCNKYSIPDTIFIQLSNISRFYDINPLKNTLVTSNISIGKKIDEMQGLNSVTRIHAYHYLLFLELFCKANNIRLFILSWPPLGYFESEPELDNFYDPNINEMSKFITDYVDSHPEDLYSLNARDGLHPGNAHQEYWANVAYKLYNRSVEENDVN